MWATGAVDIGQYKDFIRHRSRHRFFVSVNKVETLAETLVGQYLKWLKMLSAFALASRGAKF
jgi:hypothetical protein